MCCIGNMNGKYARSDSLGAAPGVKSVVFNCLVKIIAKHEQKQKFCYRRVLSYLIIHLFCVLHNISAARLLLFY